MLAWRLANTLTTDFCVDAVQEAITRSGPPELFNTDQGCQFTSQEFMGLLKTHDIQISMDGAGRWRDNVFVERLWRSLKYEEVWVGIYLTLFYAGARPVLVSLWDANSQQTVPMMKGLHEALSQGNEPPAAFQLAVKPLTDTVPDPYWANWYLVGIPSLKGDSHERSHNH